LKLSLSSYAKNLALLVQEEINGEKSRFNKIVSRDTVET
jgi:hypothetical protein